MQCSGDEAVSLRSRWCLLQSIRLIAALGLIIWLAIAALGGWSQPKAGFVVGGLLVWGFLSGGAIAYHTRSVLLAAICYAAVLGGLIWWSNLPNN